MAASSISSGCPPVLEIKGGTCLVAVAFSADGEYILTGDWLESVQKWRIEDGNEVATMKAMVVQCLAVSKDGKRIAAGTMWRGLFVWDAKTHEQVFAYKEDSPRPHVEAIDFSPDSTRLVSASQTTALVFDIAAGRRVQSLYHLNEVEAAKYSPQGDRIATATFHGVRVWDGNDGHLLVEISEGVIPLYNKGLLWFDSHLLVMFHNKIKEIEASTGSVVSEWSVPDTDTTSCISLPSHGAFVASSAKRTVSFWDMSTHALLAEIHHTRDIHSIALSPDDRLIVIGGKSGKITVNSLSHIAESIPSSRLHPIFREPDFQVDDAILDLWKLDRLSDAERLLIAAITTSQKPTYHLLAIRALVRARLREWDPALVDAEKSIDLQPSVIGYVAKSLALVGKGEKHDGYRACDTAFERFHSSFANFILLIKAIIVFIAGEHWDAVSQMDHLVTAIRFNSVCYVVQAHMNLQLGNSHMHNGDYASAIQSFEHAQAQMQHDTSRTLFVVSLISGWKFDHLDITIQYCLCGALYAAGRTKDAGESLLKIMDTSDEEVNKSKWVSDFTHRYLPASESGADASDGTQHSKSPMLAPLVREWAKAALTNSKWSDALNAAVSFKLPRVTIYQVVCECLEGTNRMTDAIECWHEMRSELGEDIYTSEPMSEWVSEFMQRCLSAPESNSEAVSNTTPPPLLREWAKVRLSSGVWKDVLISAVDFSLPRNTIYRVICERLEVMDRVTDAIECFHGMTSELGEDICTIEHTSEWASGFMRRRFSASESHSGIASRAASISLLRKWAKAEVACGSWKDALLSAANFTLPRVAIYQAVCEHLEAMDCLMDVIECFHQMTSELGGETNLQGEHLRWALDFRLRLSKKLEYLGDIAVDAQQHDKAISQYTTALSLDPPSAQGILVKRCKAFMETGSWRQAIDNANKVIALDPSSPWGYETKCTALHKAGDYDDAIGVFEVMLSKISQSPDPQHANRYISPLSVRAAIRRIVQQTIRHSPRVLVNTTTGHLHSRAERASAFESLPVFKELVSSMMTRIDYVRIKREVRRYFRYVMLSHKWEDNEPLFQKVIHMAVYDLDKSPTHDKLQTFCKIVRDAGFNWAWSDTCCIDKSDHFVLQEALVAMFKWYQGSAMMIVFLRGVHSSSQLGALTKSIWNTRAWTLQEYVASKVIHFYTEDWTCYLDLELPNHKESPKVISEMEQATGISAERLMALRPGLTSIREKLRLASTRQTTLVEDAAYSLLGIFSVAGVPAIYGEGEASLGRLLAHVLAGSGDVSILAWTGESGSYNSCLPAYITVFNRPATSHLPSPIPDAEMESIITASQTSFDIDVALKLYDRLDELPTPWFAASRMRLPCIAFELPPFSSFRTRSSRIYRTDTVTFGTVKIKTRHDLSRMKSLYLVHPWLDTLLEREDKSGVIDEEDIAPPPSSDMDDEEESSDQEIDDDEEILDEEIDDDHLSLVEELPSHSTPARSVPMDKETRARRLVAHLGRPFGALLVTLASTGGRTVDYRRVAADTVITVQFQENVSLADILDNVRTLDVL